LSNNFLPCNAHISFPILNYYKHHKTKQEIATDCYYKLNNQNGTSIKMNTMASANDFDLFTPSTPNKRKLSEERDDDVIVTPSSSYDSDSDDNARDTDSFVSTPIPDYESPLKRRRMSGAALDYSRFSPPLMPRFQYRPSTLEQQNDQSLSFTRGRPVLDIFTSDREQPENALDLSFLSMPTPPSNVSEMDEAKIPFFALSPRTTMGPPFPYLVEGRRLFVGNAEEEKENGDSLRRRILPSLRMRPSKQQLGKNRMVEELSLPTLTIRETRRERRSSLPAVAA